MSILTDEDAHEWCSQFPSHERVLDGNRLRDDWLRRRWSRMSQQKIVDPNFAVGRFEEGFEKLNDDALEAVSTH